jgi:hypothetical protein
VKKLIGICGTAAVAAAILAAPGGAAKPAFSVTCTVGTGGQTTVTWLSGTTSAEVTWRDATATPLVSTTITVMTHGPDSTVLETPPVAPDNVNVRFFGKKPGFAMIDCTPPA